MSHSDDRPAHTEDESRRVSDVSAWYLTDQLDIDRQLIQFRYRTLRPHLRGTEGLELGPAEGVMTQYLLDHFERLTVVEGAQELLAQIPDAPNLAKVHSLFEDYAPESDVDTIVMEHILEHVDDPGSLLKQAAGWLAPGGRLLAGVPNGHSLHRLAAVQMGLLQDPCELNARDHALGHRRVYTPSSFRREMEEAGLTVVESGGVFLKPLSNRQIQGHWTPEMIEAFYELGKQFPEHSAELYVVCARSGAEA